MTKIEETIQVDLDNGNFYRICGNETLFKHYVINLFLSLRQKEMEELAKKIKGLRKENKRTEKWSDDYYCALDDILSILTNEAI